MVYIIALSLFFFIFVLFLFGSLLFLKSTCNAEMHWQEGTQTILVKVTCWQSLLSWVYEQKGGKRKITARFCQIPFFSWKIKETKSNSEEKVAKPGLKQRLSDIIDKFNRYRALAKKLFNSGDLESFKLLGYLSWRHPALTGMVYGLYFMLKPIVPRTIDFQIIPTDVRSEPKCSIFLKYHFYFYKILNILLKNRNKENVLRTEDRDA